MPPSSESCDIPNCDRSVTAPSIPRLDARRQVRPKDNTETFRQGPVITLASNVTDVIAPTPSPSYSFSAAGGWLYTEWSEVSQSDNFYLRVFFDSWNWQLSEIQCVGWCVGGGVQSRGVRCADPSGCATSRVPESIQTCSVKRQCEAQWFTGKHF